MLFAEHDTHRGAGHRKRQGRNADNDRIAKDQARENEDQNREQEQLQHEDEVDLEVAEHRFQRIFRQDRADHEHGQRRRDVSDKQEGLAQHLGELQVREIENERQHRADDAGGEEHFAERGAFERESFAGLLFAASGKLQQVNPVGEDHEIERF